MNKSKLKTFWWKHGWKILGITGLMLAAYAGGRVDRKIENKALEEKAAKEAAAKADRNKRLEEWRLQREAYEADPKNHLGDCGLVEEDIWEEPAEWVNIIVSNVPVEKMGEFGEELAKRAQDQDISIEGGICSVVVSISLNENSEETAKEAMDEKEVADAESLCETEGTD